MKLHATCDGWSETTRYGQRCGDKGIVTDKGFRVWYCPHIHANDTLAVKCAQREVDRRLAAQEVA